ncbi:hypothetical protein M3231_11985 [Neobacillus mesonae]|nr:hypothetical protein [Neobacillus mesonae]
MTYIPVIITPEQYEIARKRGITKNLLEQRVRRLGWPIEKAIKKKPQKKIDYGNWPKVAEENDITPTAFYNRVLKLNWSPEKAATVPVRIKREPGTIEVKKKKRRAKRRKVAAV